jgi:triose/dihydroxyacetone kinase / FAD-AMP lyase (cyclizing)
MMKKLINRPEAAVDEMLEGMVALNPCVVRLSHLNVLVRSDFAAMRDRQVALISGGGSGHEPAHAGYIGEGMLSAAVAGEIFTSPTVDAIFAAIKTVAGKPGVLLIVKNYTGDRLNFGLAAEMARAEGIAVRMVIVADDVALLDKQNDGEQQSAGARGLAGTVLIHKIAGAIAAEGKSLEDVSAAAAAAAGSMGTMGLALSAGTSPTLGEPSFVLGEREIELGLGIHGEPGVRRTLLSPSDQLTDTLIETILSAGELRAGERVVALVNNLGATTTMEMDIVARRTFLNLASRGLNVERIYSGTLLTSLDMAGISLTLLSVDDKRLRLLDAATSAPGWPNFPRQRPTPVLDRVQDWGAPVPHATEARATPQSGPGKQTEKAITAACLALLDAEPGLTEMDRVVGDGDLGISMARGAKAVQDALPGYPLNDLPATLKAIGYTLQAALGGASGPLYGVLFIRGGSALEGRHLEDMKQWADALTEACHAMSELGGAKTGDRTMLDALIPFAETLKGEAAKGGSAEEILEAAAAAAVRGAEQAAHMLPRRGRSSYLGERALGHGDPGATAVSIWVRAIVSSLSA